jgi:hypothetical protein
MIPTDALRYIGLEKGFSRDRKGTDDIFRKIADDLGVIPDNRVRVFVLR